jgi:hypothetical protein
MNGSFGSAWSNCEFLLISTKLILTSFTVVKGKLIICNSTLLFTLTHIVWCPWLFYWWNFNQYPIRVTMTIFCTIFLVGIGILWIPRRLCRRPFLRIIILNSYEISFLSYRNEILDLLLLLPNIHLFNLKIRAKSSTSGSHTIFIKWIQLLLPCISLNFG